ncbi:AfsR family transcriptional regulator [Streptomyces sp. SID8359]|uniref:AfsR/SARP family transcriptional regulator n=1 Tax=unclassified Streptomyces TaxID=2593676 RepID=UPI00048F20E3|nr:MULTISPECIES: AfsR/SARP family transcriptional regulator [unclassified Streptomyces]MYT94940.1 AfsR family transcriptional regulator [Streptomyces sp. SID8359]
MNFLLLGPLSVRLNAREVHVSAPRQRVVMAALLLNANRVISVDRITEYVWDGAPPPSAAATVRTYVMRLRQSLGEHASARILTRAPGYLLELGEHESDLGQFTAHRRRAAELAERGDLESSSAELAEALALWREEPLADIPSRTLRDVEGRYLQELRLQTMELRFDAELALLRHAEIVPELVRLVREHPLREALVGKLMLALFRSGRQSEALDLYRRTRVLLVEQLGAEPGADLREVHRRILSAHHDRPRTPAPRAQPAPAPGTAAAPAAATVRERSGWPDPAQLPSVPLPLAARSDALARVRHFLTTGTMPAGMVATAVVTGRGGVGKSALALHAAHTMRDSSVHGQLYADLGGAERPLTAREVLPRFLADLGVPRDEIPGEESERESLYRSLTAGRRLLVVLDNASGSAQVRPLIPGSGGSRLLVTSRRRLADLEGARTLLLGPLDEAGSLELLGGIVGTAGVGGEPRAARAVVTVCAGLPLAIRIAATRLLERPHWSIGHLARRLTEAPRLLDELCAGDVGVRPCLDAEVAGLRRTAPGGIDPAEVLAALGTTGASSVSSGEVAVLFGCPEAQAEEALDSLVVANLLDAPAGGRYRLDALLRAYARERAQEAAVRGRGRSYMRAG